MRNMKNTGLCFTLLVFLSNINCGQATSTKKTIPTESFAEIKFEKENIEIGKIEAKKMASLEYKFYNIGNIPLTITNAKGACYCVKPKWTEQSIAPGDSSVITVTFDPEDVTGFFQRALTVQSNAKRKTVELLFTGEIVPISKKDTLSSSGKKKSKE